LLVIFITCFFFQLLLALNSMLNHVPRFQVKEIEGIHTWKQIASSQLNQLVLDNAILRFV
jgi:hypothetical protein